MAGHMHALARSPAPWRKESITHALPLERNWEESSSPSAPPLLPWAGSALSHVPGELKKATEKGWNNSAARTSHAEGAGDTWACSMYLHKEEVML